MFLETADIETASDDYASRFGGAIGEYFLAVQYDITRSLLDDALDISILDVGGGHAQLSAPLARDGFRVTVTGSDESCRQRLDRELPEDSFTFTVCDMLALPYDNDSFDHVIAFRLLPHVERWQQVIGEMCRVARKSVIFDYPDSRSSNILYDSLFSMKKKYEKNTRTFTLFNRSQISREIIRNGFSQPVFKPQFFLPMVVHRKFKSVGVSKTSEALFRALLLTRWLGSPIIAQGVTNRYRSV